MPQMSAVTGISAGNVTIVFTAYTYGACIQPALSPYTSEVTEALLGRVLPHIGDLF